MMKNLAYVLVTALALAACGSKQQTPVENTGTGSGSAAGPADTRTAIEKRRDTACEELGPRITTCAVKDAKVALTDGKITQKQYDDITQSGVLKKNTEEFIDSCKTPKTAYSSRQIRVLEVCPKEELECEPMMACLDNLNKP
jgi:major membrane immunogen (membrane-anchored lipoprotein)